MLLLFFDVPTKTGDFGLSNDKKLLRGSTNTLQVGETGYDLAATRQRRWFRVGNVDV